MPSNASRLTETFVGRTGQMLLDDLGIVRTVQSVETDTNGDTFVIVDPPFPTEQQRWIAFTPQVPVAIKVIRVEVP